MDEELKEELAIYLHSTWSKWINLFLKECMANEPTSMGDVTLVVPDDLRRRTNVKSNLSFRHLSPAEKRKIMVDVEGLVSILKSSRSNQFISMWNFRGREDATVVTKATQPMMAWQSVNDSVAMGGDYLITKKPTEEAAGWMSDEEMKSFADAVKRVELETRPVMEMKSISTRSIKGRGKIKTVRCDKEIAEWVKDLPNRSVVIDGVNWFVCNVECFIPVKEGDTIGLVVREPRGSERLVLCKEHGWSHALYEKTVPILSCSKCYSREGPPFYHIDILEESDE